MTLPPLRDDALITTPDGVAVRVSAAVDPLAASDLAAEPDRDDRRQSG